MAKFKQARRTATFKKVYMQKKKAFTRSRSRLPILGSQSISTVVSANPPFQRSFFSKGKCLFSGVKDALLSTGNFPFPTIRNTVFFSSCNIAFLSLRDAVWSKITCAIYCASKAAHSTRKFAFTCCTNGMKSLLVALLSVWWWCWRNMRQSFVIIKNILFPSCTYLRELDAVKQQVQKLEIELSLLQDSIKRGVNIGSLECSSSPSCQKSTVLSTRLSAISSNLFQPASPSPHVVPSWSPCALLPPLMLPPPAPPPPPPPPLPPPTFFVQKTVVIPKKAVNSAALKAAPSKKEGPVQVTLKDLLNVKLKKTNDNVERQKRSPKKGRSPLVSLLDLQSVNLRTSSSLSQNQVPHILICSPNKGQADFRKHLKKVNLQRSPGGTPLYDRENKDSGTGLTPIMTRALKQKFQEVTRIKMLSPLYSWSCRTNEEYTQMALPRSPPSKHVYTENRSFDEIY